MSSDTPRPADDAVTPAAEAAKDCPPGQVASPSSETDAPPADAPPADASPADASPAEALPAEALPAEALPAEAASDTPQLKPKIQVGSRRSDAGAAVQSSRPQLARKDKPVTEGVASAAAAVADALGKSIDSSLPIEAVAPVRGEKIPTPSVRDPLSPEMEAELYAAIGDVSLDAIVDDEAAVAASQQLELDARIRGEVVRIEGDNIFFKLIGRNEGACSVRAFKEPPAVGAHMDVVPKKYNSDDGLYEVAVPGASIEVADWSDLTEGALVEGRITGANTGGLECMVNTIRAFIPASQVALFRVEDFAEYIGQKLLCVVTEVNPKKKNLVLSHRALLEREREEARKKLIAELAVGQMREGVVSNIRDFGAFVDLGGIDGLIHISQLSWDRVNHPSEVLENGQKVKVKIEKINQETGKIGLSYRELIEHPWEGVEDKFPAGTQVKGAVTRIAQFGAFVKLAPGVEGLIHISEMAHQRIRAVSDVVKEGEEIEVKILAVDREAQKIALSLKATLPEPESREEAADDEPQEMVVAKREGPLRGGRDKPSGGEKFGLKW